MQIHDSECLETARLVGSVDSARKTWPECPNRRHLSTDSRAAPGSISFRFADCPSFMLLFNGFISMGSEREPVRELGRRRRNYEGVFLEGRRVTRKG